MYYVHLLWTSLLPSSRFAMASEAPPAPPSPAVPYHQITEEVHRGVDYEDYEEEAQERNAYVPPDQLRNNTPKKGKFKLTQSTSQVWKHVKRITGDHAECRKKVGDKTKKTHVCTYHDEKGTCYALLRLYYNKNKEVWATTEVLEHFRKEHPSSSIGSNQSRKRVKRDEGMRRMLNVGPDDAEVEEITAPWTTF